VTKLDDPSLRAAKAFSQSVARSPPRPTYLSSTLPIAYRSRQLQFRRKQIAQWLENEHELLKLEVDSVVEEGRDEFLRECIALIESEAVRQEKDALATFGMLAGHDDRVAPVRRALAVWGLTLDDLGVVSIHGTSTQANEKNETSVYNDVFTNIGRTPGNAVGQDGDLSEGGSPALHNVDISCLALYGQTPAPHRNSPFGGPELSRPTFRLHSSSLKTCCRSSTVTPPGHICGKHETRWIAL